jgi:hypothetical protein
VDIPGQLTPIEWELRRRVWLVHTLTAAPKTQHLAVHFGGDGEAAAFRLDGL